MCCVWKLTYALAVILLLSCERKESYNPAQADLPSVRILDDGTSEIEEYGISFVPPADWRVLNAEDIQAEDASGHRSITGRDRTPDEIKQMQFMRHFYAVRKYPDTYKGYNPSLAFVSFDKAFMKEQGVDDLDDLARSWSETGHPYELDSGPIALKIGEFNGYCVRLSAKLANGNTLFQHMYAIEVSQYYLSATVSILESEDRKVLEDVLRSLKKLD